MHIEKVNNVFEPISKNGNKPVSKSAVYTHITETAGEDTFYKRHKTAVITGGIIAGIIAIESARQKTSCGNK